MLNPLDIAVEVHKICLEFPESPGVSPTHDIDLHSLTTRIYAQAINDAGLSVTGKQATEAIIEAAGWSVGNPWPGHPSTDSVVDLLKLIP